MTKSLGIADASRNSTMKRWMHKNRIRFASELTEAGKPNWTVIAQMMADLGLRDAKGGKPNRHTAMMTWRRVAAERPINQPKPANFHKPEAVPLPTPLPATPTQDDAAAMRERLRQMTNKRSVR